MSKRNTELYLEDIKTAIKTIGKYTRGLSFADFSRDPKTVDAVVRNLEIIGEAAQNLPKEFKGKHRNIPWRKAVGMRNKIIHEYFGVDREILWQTISEDIPKFQNQIKKIR